MDDETKTFIDQLRRRPFPPIQAALAEWAEARQQIDDLTDRGIKRERGDISNRDFKVAWKVAWLAMSAHTSPRQMELVTRLLRAINEAVQHQGPPNA